MQYIQVKEHFNGATTYVSKTYVFESNFSQLHGEVATKKTYVFVCVSKTYVFVPRLESKHKRTFLGFPEPESKLEDCEVLK